MSTNAQKATPTPTRLALVNPTPGSIHEQVATLETKVGKLREELKTTRNFIATELQSSKRGTTRANAKAASLETQLEQLAARMQEIDSLSAGNPAIAKGFQPELTRIADRLEELFGLAMDEIGKVRDEVTKLAGTSAEHTVQIVMLEEGQESLNQRVNGVHDRVTILEKIQKVPVWPLIVGLVVGLIVWWLMRYNVSYTQTLTMADGTTVPFTDEGAQFRNPLLLGAATFFAITGFLYLFTTRRAAKTQETKVVETETHYEIPVRKDEQPTSIMPPITGSEPPKPAPTRISVIPGASTGAH